MTRYDFHGLGLEIAADDPELAAAIDGRFRAFARAAARGPADVALEYRRGAAMDRPGEQGRPVYVAPSGEVAYLPGEDRMWIDDADGVQVLCDPGGGRATVAVADHRAADLWMLSRPMVTLPLLELLKRRGLFGVHAAAVAREGRGVLLPGSSGSGKSTLALALVRAGFELLGDDMLFLRPGDDGPVALAFPDEIDVTGETARFFPELRELAAAPPPPGWAKHRVRAEDLFGAPPAISCRPELLVFPAIAGGGRSELTPMEPTDALRELAPNVLLTDPTAAQAHLDALSALVREARCYRLATGTDFDRVPALVERLLG